LLRLKPALFCVGDVQGQSNSFGVLQVKKKEYSYGGIA